MHSLVRGDIECNCSKSFMYGGVEDLGFCEMFKSESHHLSQCSAI